MTRRPTRWALSALFLLLIALGACRREETGSETVGAPDDPVAAVQAQAAALRDNDLARFARLSLPPDLYRRSAELWDRRVALAEPADPADAAEYEQLMSRLLADDAEEALMRDLEPKLAQLEAELAGQWPLMQATAGIFLAAAVQASEDLSPEQKAHASELITALLAWLRPELITDRQRARQAIAAAARTARQLDLPTLEQSRALDHEQALAKGSVALAGAKEIARAYGLDLDRALDGMQAELVSQEGDRATVRVRYPLLGTTLAFERAMVRREGGWYAAEDIAQAEAELAQAETELADPAAAAGQDAEGDSAAPAASDPQASMSGADTAAD
ncbi:hypothetical protein [Arenimonas fontis]|uniref:Uncharacterized protein n=1 Tax=Arenimonas fontis TaxID=2608255 RepID=A0A5B2Z8F6_9GAMM|nr:hypothetical protein [Arenimonas fontis]KAA2284259.1 hypothetical protein F0415_10210 [Arenimonas fontis]